VRRVRSQKSEKAGEVEAEQPKPANKTKKEKFAKMTIKS
jgi:hypothetical protein